MESCDEGKWMKVRKDPKIRVGAEFQAAIPTIEPHSHTFEEEKHQSTQSKLFDCFRFDFRYFRE